MNRGSAYWLPLWAIAVMGAACGGKSRLDSTAMPGGTGGATSGSGGNGGSDVPSCWCPPGCNANEKAFAPARIWQITDRQYANIVRDVLGITLSGSDTEISQTGDASGDFRNLADERPTFTDMLAMNYMTAAEKVAERASAPAVMARLLGSSTPSVEDVAAFVATKVPRLLRRPITATETATLMKIYSDANSDASDAAYAFGLIIEAVLQWPSFLFRTELGPGDAPAQAPFRLTPHELAAATSFALADSAPDEALWNKADNATLTSSDVLAAEVDRLLALPSVQTNLAKYLSYWLWIERVPSREKDPVLFPEYTPTLRQSLYESGFAFLKDTATSGTLSDLFTSRKIYVNREISDVYGIPGGTGVLPTALQAVSTTQPERGAGLLTQPALLAATNKRPALLDPIHHGLFVLLELLDGADTGPIPAPPAGELAAAAAMQGTERELAQKRGQTSACSGCHPLFDNYGLTRSRYDAIGRYSETRYVNGDTSVTPASYTWATSPTPIDASATIPAALGPDLKGTLADTPALAAQLDSDRVRRRVAFSAGRHLARYAVGYDATQLNSCGLYDLKEHLYRTGSFRSFFKELITSSGFQTRHPGM